TGFLENVELVEPDVATDADLTMAHSKEYLEKVENLAAASKPLSLDTPLSPGAPLSAKRIVGGVLKAGEISMSKGSALGFGGMHHAYRSKGGGFCIYNDVAILVASLKSRGCSRILNLDTDAHCGDGTMDIFLMDPEVLYISLHQDPDTIYPGVGRIRDVGIGEGEGFTINVPMPLYSTTEEYKRAFEEVVLPVAIEFKPQVVIRNGGSDPAGWDLLTSLDMDMGGLSYLGSMGRKISQETGAKMIDLVLSGYGGGISEGWLAIWSGALDVDIDLKFDYSSNTDMEERMAVSSDMDKNISSAKKKLSEYWSCLA
ncbi:MAG: histone deacetylase, partial [Candidatus Thermoplasmatota archaeon]|nr:histone deacetylase [Candidatus Thermoplasmatota archaeon]